jgi:hypothetical protein
MQERPNIKVLRVLAREKGNIEGVVCKPCTVILHKLLE